ncbi:hypothetical protein F5B21DRAFT_453087 [Xylaria acuta]|nr:hypothetical protein F5B21DRAFT_453087 [Xylaria acuta]
MLPTYIAYYVLCILNAYLLMSDFFCWSCMEGHFVGRYCVSSLVGLLMLLMLPAYLPTYLLTYKG